MPPRNTKYIKKIHSVLIQNAPEPEGTSLFYSSNSPDRKSIQFTIIQNRERQQILTVAKPMFGITAIRSSDLLSDQLSEEWTNHFGARMSLALSVCIVLVFRALCIRPDVSMCKCSPGIQSTAPPSRLPSWLQPAGGWAEVWGRTANKQCNQVGGTTLRFNKENRWTDHTHTNTQNYILRPSSRVFLQGPQRSTKPKEGLSWANWGEAELFQFLQPPEAVCVCVCVHVCLCAHTFM